MSNFALVFIPVVFAGHGVHAQTSAQTVNGPPSFECQHVENCAHTSRDSMKLLQHRVEVGKELASRSTPNIESNALEEEQPVDEHTSDKHMENVLPEGPSKLAVQQSTLAQRHVDPVDATPADVRVSRKDAITRWMRKGFLFHVVQLGVVILAGVLAVSWIYAFHQGRIEARKACFWVAPMALFCCCFCFQNACLRLSTAYYIEAMERLDSQLRTVKNESLVTTDGYRLSSTASEGALHDMVAQVVGFHKIPLAALDGGSASIPLLWLFLSIGMGDLSVWTRCLTCGSMLAIGKGTLGLVTIVPDSSGWSQCKKRLTGESGEKMEQDWKKVRSVATQFRSFGQGLVEDILFMELFGVSVFGDATDRTRLRYCADMMYSGHTYFVVNFSLGLYELIWKATQKRMWLGMDMTGFMRTCIRGLVVAVLIFICLVEAILVIMNRFHYTMDILVAILLCLLWHGNVAVASCVGHWVSKSPKGKSGEGSSKDHESEDNTMEEDGLEGEVYIAPCCLPFCCFAGRYRVMI